MNLKTVLWIVVFSLIFDLTFAQGDEIFYYNIEKDQILQGIENGTLTFTCREFTLVPMEILLPQKLVMLLGVTYITNIQNQSVFQQE